MTLPFSKCDRPLLRRCRSRGFALLPAAGLLACLSSGSARSMENLPPGGEPPPLTLPATDGKIYTLDYFSGGAGVILFWSTWSPRSAEILEDFRKHHSEFSDRGLKVLAVNSDGENLSSRQKSDIRAYAGERDLPFPVLLDEELEAFAAYGVMAHPSAVVLDREGRISYTLGGYPLSLRETLRDSILKALGLYRPATAEELPAAVPVARNGALQYHRLGMNLLSRGQVERALDSFRKASERDPEFLDPRIMESRLSLAAGDRAAAESLIGAVDLETVNRSDLRYLQGALLLAQGDVDAGERVFAVLAEANPGEGWGEWGLGMVLLVKGDLEGGIGRMQEASSLQPRNLEAEFFLRRRLTGSWQRGETPPGEEAFLALFPSLLEKRDRYRQMFRAGG